MRIFKTWLKYGKNHILSLTRKFTFWLRYRCSSNEYFFISPYGIGDTFYILSLLSEFQKANPLFKIRLGLVKRSHLDLVNLFSLKNIRICLLKPKYLRLCPRDTFKPGIPVVLHPHYFMGTAILSLLGYNGILLRHVYRILLNLPVHAKHDFNIITNSRVTLEALELFQSYGLIKGKTVVIATSAKSIDEKLVPVQFWKELVDQITNAGYQVAFVGSEGNIPAPGIKQVEFPLSLTIPFLNNCHAFISLRSGICELAAFSSCTKIILYPVISWYDSTLIEGSSIKKMNFGIEPLHEVEITDSSNPSAITKFL